MTTQINGTTGVDKVQSGAVADHSKMSISVKPIGVGQTWQSVARTSGTTYTNSTGRPIMVSAQVVSTAANPGFTVTVGGVAIYPTVLVNTANVGYFGGSCTFIVPDGTAYVMTVTNGTLSVSELR